MAKHIFENTPFYQWFRRCSECGKRSIWTPMARCAACETYNHRRCNKSHAMRMESTDDSLLATQDDFVVIDLDEMAPFGCTEQPRPGTSSTMYPITKSAGDVLRRADDSSAVYETAEDERNSATAQVEDEPSAAVADEKGETFMPQENPSPSPEQPRAEGNCCWLIAQYPKTFWPNHRHFLHSSDCLVFPFPKPTGTAVPEDGGDHLQTWPWSSEEDVVEKISAETMTTGNLQSFL